jgi:hypothetical protein
MVSRAENRVPQVPAQLGEHGPRQGVHPNQRYGKSDTSAPQTQTSAAVSTATDAQGDPKPLAAEVGRVLFREVSPLLRKIVSGKYGRDGARGHTGSAVNALDRVDKQLVGFGVVAFVFLGVDAIDRRMQSTGQASTQAVSLVPIQGSAMT